MRALAEPCVGHPSVRMVDEVKEASYRGDAFASTVMWFNRRLSGRVRTNSACHGGSYGSVKTYGAKYVANIETAWMSSDRGAAFHAYLGGVTSFATKSHVYYTIRSESSASWALLS